jgi:dTDP-4-amino-4,6-dideoxygalactose transaminase
MGEAWNRHWLTNQGTLHERLAAELADYLGAPYLSLTTSATMGLMLACRGLGVTGEVITTPFTFPATPQALTWCGLTPVFADIDPGTMTLSPEAVARAVTPATSAILGVHVYGVPCQVQALQDIADRHGLKVIYDAAHAFDTRIDDTPVVHFGDASALSFHATKLFHTAEGGAVVSNDPALKERVDLLRNFGIRDEVTVELAGINGKLNELQAALGLANLPLIAAERTARAEIAAVYIERLAHQPGVTCIRPPSNVVDSRQYFAIRIDGSTAKVGREALYKRLREFNVFTRRYFFPLCSEYEFYRHLQSSRPENLPVAHQAAREVLCLPYFGSLGTEIAHRICDLCDYIFDNPTASNSHVTR